MNTAVIIPVKQLSCAKQRLAGLFTAEQRAGLVLAMLEDLLNTLSFVDRRDVHLVSADDSVLGLARKFSLSTIPEPYSIGYNRAVEWGFQHIKDDRGVAVIPADVPLARVHELAELVAPADPQKPTIRLAAARDLKGTNGLYLSSKTLLKPYFGLNSFTNYQRACRHIEIEPCIIDAPYLAHDIDTQDDVFDLLKIQKNTVTHKFLAQSDNSRATQLLLRGSAA